MFEEVSIELPSELTTTTRLVRSQLNGTNPAPRAEHRKQEVSILSALRDGSNGCARPSDPLFRFRCRHQTRERRRERRTFPQEALA